MLDRDSSWEWNCESSSKTNNIFNYIGKKIKNKNQICSCLCWFCSNLKVPHQYIWSKKQGSRCTIRHKIKLENFNHECRQESILVPKTFQVNIFMCLLHLLNVANSSTMHECLHYMYTFLYLHMVLKMFQAYLCDFWVGSSWCKIWPFCTPIYCSYFSFADSFSIV